MNLVKLIPKPIKLLIKHFNLLIRRFLERKSIQMSQAGQDLWVFGEAFDEMRKGYFLDIGAHDGIKQSNSYILECRYDWSGILVEANPESFEQLMKNRRGICVNECLDSDEGFVDFVKRGTGSGIISPDTDNSTAKSYEVIKIKTKTLESLLKEQSAPHLIDYLSIDIEGAEERVLGNFNFKEYQFNCITIERPTKYLRQKFEENAYILIKEIPDLDCFYIHKSFLNQYQTNIYKFYNKKFLMMRWK
jgi:FkbM family methyltransferase